MERAAEQGDEADEAWSTSKLRSLSPVFDGHDESSVTTATRAGLGHLTGVVCSVAVASQAPRMMDAVLCGLARVFSASSADACRPGFSNLGEGGFIASWGTVAALVFLVGIMEVVLRLQRWYHLPPWSGLVVFMLGCPTVATVLCFVALESGPGAVSVGALLGVPVGLAASAYWVPLVTFRR